MTTSTLTVSGAATRPACWTVTTLDGRAADRVGGGGVNAVNRMIEVGLKGVEFIAVNTDSGTPGWRASRRLGPRRGSVNERGATFEFLVRDRAGQFTTAFEAGRDDGDAHLVAERVSITVPKTCEQARQRASDRPQVSVQCQLADQTPHRLDPIFQGAADFDNAAKLDRADTAAGRCISPASTSPRRSTQQSRCRPCHNLEPILLC